MPNNPLDPAWLERARAWLVKVYSLDCVSQQRAEQDLATLLASVDAAAREGERAANIVAVCEHCAVGNAAFIVEPGYSTDWTHEFVHGTKVSRGGCRASAIRDRATGRATGGE